MLAKFRRALQLRPGARVGVLAGGAVACLCGTTIDPFGVHYGACKEGNRSGAWTHRHDLVEAGVIAATSESRVRVRRVTSNVLGEVAVTSARDNYMSLDTGTTW